MKQTYTLLLFFFVAFSACKKEDNSPASKIVGKWLIQKDVNSTFDTMGTANYSTTLNYNATGDAYYLFNKDKTGEMQIIQGGAPAVHQFKYDDSKVSNVVLIPDYLKESIDYQITKVDENQIILTHDEYWPDQSRLKFREEIYLIKK